MAKIKTYKIFFNDKQFDLDMKYSAKTEWFFVNLPLEMSEIIQSEKLQAKTMKELEALIKKTIQDTEQNKMTKRKVLVFAFEFSGERKGLGKSRWGRSENDRIEMKFFYKVAMEQMWKGTKHYFVKRDYAEGEDKKKWDQSEYFGHVSQNEGLRIIDWTEERERFLASVDKSMVDAIKRVKGFMRQSPEKITKAIDAGPGNLLGSGK